VAEETTPRAKMYRLVLDFEVWVNDELITTAWDEADLNQEERAHLAAQRRLLQALLEDRRGIFEELLRKRVLEEADYGLDDEWKARLLIRNVSDEQLLEPLIEELPDPERLTLLEAIAEERLEKVAGEAIHSIGVELVGVSLGEIEDEERSEYL
jgi:hypothetical protein